MHLVFERSKGRFKSNCNILALAWTPYYNETLFRVALFDYHQKQLINLTSSIAGTNQEPARGNGVNINVAAAAAAVASSANVQANNNSNNNQPQPRAPPNQPPAHLNSRVAELYQRHAYLKSSNITQGRGAVDQDQENGNENENANKKSKTTDYYPASVAKELYARYGRMSNFGWLVVGNVGKIVAVTLTSTLPPLLPAPDQARDHHHHRNNQRAEAADGQEDLMQFHEHDVEPPPPPPTSSGNQSEPSSTTITTKQPTDSSFRPDNGILRDNYNLRGHLDEVILVKWNELYQKLATIDSKGNVLIWCKINEKFTIQTPFYNRTKTVADFKWSNDGKTALICYTDSFILVGSSSGQRHWHSMLNLDDYHITCASWTPNDEQLLLGVSNGNVVVIDLPRSELTELVVNQTNIRTMCWSSSYLSLSNLVHPGPDNPMTMSPDVVSSGGGGGGGGESSSSASSYSSSSSSPSTAARNTSNSAHRRHSTVVNHRRLSRDCSVFSRYRFCSQAPSNVRARNTSLDLVDSAQQQASESNGNSNNAERIFNFLPPPTAGRGPPTITNANDNVDTDRMHQQQQQKQCDNKKQQQRNILAIDFANNTIKLYDGGLDDPEPRTIQVNQESYIMHWSGDGKYLAVAGFNIHTTAPSVGCLRCRYLNSIKFYNQRGQLIYEHTMRYTRYPITAFTWAHDDKRLFVATGPRLHCAKVFLGIPPLSLLAVSCFQQYTKIPDKGDVLDMIVEDKLISSSVINWRSHNCPINLNHLSAGVASGSNAASMLSPEKHLFTPQTSQLFVDRTDRDYLMNMSHHHHRLTIAQQRQQQSNVCNNSNVYQYQLPVKLQLKIDQLFTQTIRQPFDEHWTLNDIIWHVPKNEQRHYCTLVCYTSDRDINSSGYQYRTNLMDNTNHRDNHPSDQNKIFVLYVEFLGSLIPILRARRVGFLKPEFVIFDPEDGGQAIGNRLHSKQQQQQQRKVSDISQQSALLNGFLRRRLAAENQSTTNQSPVMVDHHQSTYSSSSTPFNYSNEGFADNCSELHLYSEPRASSSSLGRQSNMSDDAEHYYNFDGGRHQGSSNYNNNQYHHYNQSPSSLNNNRLADLVSDRSHHQEPVALPIMGNPYLLYMMSLSASHHTGAGGRGNVYSHNGVSMGSKPGLGGGGGGKRADRSHKLGSSSSGAGGNLTENNELIRIKSNIWGTKFKLINVGNRMIKQRSVLGSVAYKASILHLQPRQIFLTIKDMSNYCCLCSKHHHTRATHQKRPTAINKTNLTSAVPNSNHISLLDMPNLEKPFNMAQPLKGQSRMMKRSQGQQLDDGGSKIVLAVGDNIRVAPKLDRNQRYRFANTYNNQVDNQSSKALRGEGRLYFDGLRKNSEGSSSGSNKHKSRQASAGESGGGSSRNRTKNVPSYRYPSSATHSNHDNNNNNNTHNHDDGDRSMFRQQTSCSTRDVSDQQDDILTLSLGQGDQVRVEMSSLGNLGALADTRPHMAADVRPAASGSQKSGEALDEFLATNKTLKSIQTITRMIVDLSSKADNDLEDPEGLPSPSKLARLSSDVGFCGPQSRASSFVPPDTPVHRPRRLASRMASSGGQGLPSGNEGPPLERARSATTTPLKGIQSNSSSHRRHHHRRSHRKPHTMDKDSQVSSDVPLPPPPPSIPIGRRLSSSAKRFLDGSLRSLYGGGYSASSDVEPEETELLVSGRSPYKAKIAKELLRQSRNAGYSQPGTPSKRPVTSSGKQASDLSLRVQLMQRLRGEKSMPPAPAKSNRGGGDGLGRSRKSGWQYNRKGSSLNTSGLEINNKEGSSPDRRHRSRHYNLSSSYSSSSSSSTSPSSSLSASPSPSSSDDDDSDLEFNDKGRKSRNNFSASVKDLRELGRLDRRTGRPTADGNGKSHQKGGKSSGSGNRIRYRRKSMCPNSSCCCAREIELKNLPPVWNEQSQVYQLDFGGRVTQESAKNLQIDFDGKLALQFGRIDRCTYTLDYKYPFNAVQAMAIALASLTQRLK